MTVFDGYTKAFRYAWHLSMIFVLVSAGHAIYFQTCYSKAAKVLAKCQPWIASQSSSEFKVACIGSTSYSGFSYKSYNTYDSIGEQWLEEGGSCSKFFSALNPAFVDAVVIGLPANLLMLTFLILYFLAYKPIKKLPELGAIATILMAVTSGCCWNAVSISAEKNDVPEDNRMFVELKGAAITFVAFQFMATLVGAALVIILWSGYAFANRSADASRTPLVADGAENDGDIPLEEVPTHESRADTDDDEGLLGEEREDVDQADNLSATHRDREEPVEEPSSENATSTPPAVVETQEASL